jgi:hypothetical protein
MRGGIWAIRAIAARITAGNAPLAVMRFTIEGANERATKCVTSS